MNYYKIKIFQGEEDKKEIIVDEITREKIERAMDGGATRINLGEKGSYNSSQIMAIALCNEEIAEYQQLGLKINGLLETVERPRITSGFKGAGEYIKNSHFSFYAKMGWSHGEKCLCKEVKSFPQV